jgi:transcriptional regulator GlxA family with amidase domain
VFNSDPQVNDRYDRAMTRPAHQVVVLVLPEVFPLELGIAAQVFGNEPKYRLTICTPVASRSVPTAGFTVTVTAGLEALRGANTVIVPGYGKVDDPVPADVLIGLHAAHQRGVRLVSICAGAFALAEAGLLDGRPATTHWQLTDRLHREYPKIEVRPNQLYVDDGDILTSAGVTAGIDLCLHLVRSDHGAAAANACARALVAPPQRAGGQAQYIERLLPASRGDELVALRDWMLANLGARLSIDALAEQVHMSRRTFVRRFRAETGMSPMAWVTGARLDRARELLETTDQTVDLIGRRTGLGAPAGVRATFHRHLGTSPQEYRNLFRHHERPA